MEKHFDVLSAEDQISHVSNELPDHILFGYECIDCSAEDLRQIVSQKHVISQKHVDINNEDAINCWKRSF